MGSDWALEESASTDFGDERLRKRYAVILSNFGNRPNLSIPAGCSGRAEMEATYRFIHNERVTFDGILAPHRQCTLQRAAKHPIALFVQDTTELDLTRLEKQVIGAGGLDGSCRRGLFVHLLHAFSVDGTPLGTMSAQIINRPEGGHRGKRTKVQKEKERTQKPIEQKESMRWLQGLRCVRQAAEQLPDTQCICIADSEADIYELLAEPRGTAGGRDIDFIFRACRDRVLECDDGGGAVPRYPREAVMATPVLYTLQLRIRGRINKTGLELKGRRQPRDSRQATLEVRAASVRLRPPSRPDRKLPAVKVNVVIAREIDTPPGETPVEWVLLTTLPVETLEQIKAVMEYYCARWGIEILFRTLKSGCRIERRRFERIERTKRALGLYLIAAWRTMFVTRMGRECPQMDCQVIFEPSEWKAVWATTQRKLPPKKRPTLREIVMLIAQLGGHVPRQNSEPGTQTMWIGLQRMYDLASAWDAFGPESKMKHP
jgi:hypothetical protein